MTRALITYNEETTKRGILMTHRKHRPRPQIG
jgi:hypothetical protein